MMINQQSAAESDVRNWSYIRMGFYPTGIQTIQDILARYAERVSESGPDNLASRIGEQATGQADHFIYIRLSVTEWQQVGYATGQADHFIYIRLSVTEWQRVGDAFMECGNDAWEAAIASEIAEKLTNHGWRQ